MTVAGFLYFALCWHSSVGRNVTKFCSSCARKPLQFCAPPLASTHSFLTSKYGVVRGSLKVPCIYAFVCSSQKLTLQQERDDEAAGRLEAHAAHVPVDGSRKLLPNRVCRNSFKRILGHLYRVKCYPVFVFCVFSAQ